MAVKPSAESTRAGTAPGAAGATGVAISLLGTLRVLRDGREVPLPASRKARSVLAYLALARRPVHRSRLCEMFWDVPNDPRGELRWCLSKLRGVLDEPGRKRVRADRDFVAIEAGAVLVDVIAIEQALDGALEGGDVQALGALAAALDEGFLQGLVADRTPLFEAWLLARREQCRGWHCRVLDRLGALLGESLGEGDDRRLAVLRKRVEIKPDDPGCHRDLLTALAAAGRMSEGEAQVRIAARLLAAHGVSPASLEREWAAMRRAPPGPPGPSGPSPPLPTSPVHPRDGGGPGGGGPSPRAGPAHPPASPAHNLPLLLTSYVGRSEEERHVRARLARHRTVTLVGVGGAGKTRLALEIGRGLVADRPGGVWFVELAALSDPRAVGEALCSAVGVPLSEGRPARDSAIAHLRDRRALVILDNCEHLIDAVAEIAMALVEACPELGILATSRERLDVPGESLYLVPGLDLPPEGPISAEDARAHDACRLFEERARALSADFALSDANAEAIRDICRQLDGVPLAIELVVPQLRMAPLRHLAARLHDRALVAPGARRGATPRHRTLLALFDWSFNLLDPDERRLLCRLSVFNGGWSLEMAASVAGQGPEQVFEVLSRLVDKSLVAADLRGAVPRYGFLRTIHQYAIVKCGEAGEALPHARLAAAVLAVLREADETWATTPTETWLDRYQPELDNLRASLDWAFGEAGDRGLGVALFAHSLRIWDDLALLPERARWSAIAFANADPSISAPVMARLWLGQMSDSAHGDRTNFGPAQNAAELFRQCGDARGLGEALAGAGAALQTPSTTGEARPYLEEALRILAPLGPSKPLARCLRSLAMARYFEHDFALARPLLGRSEAVARAVGDLRGLAAVQLAAADLSFAAGDPERAVGEIDALMAGRHGSRRQTLLGVTNLAAYLLGLDRVAEAHAAGLRALEEARALDWQAAVVRAVEHLALVAALAGEHEAAAGMLGYCVAFYATGKASREHTEIASFERLKGSTTAALGPARLEVLAAEGALWTVDQAAERARMELRLP